MTDLMTQTLSPSPEAMDAVVGDETVILHIGNGTYYGLDSVGTVIWEGVKAGRTLPEIRATILATYDVTEPVAEADMQRFLTDLIDNGILVAS